MHSLCFSLFDLAVDIRRLLTGDEAAVCSAKYNERSKNSFWRLFVPVAAAAVFYCRDMRGFKNAGDGRRHEQLPGNDVQKLRTLWRRLLVCNLALRWPQARARFRLRARSLRLSLARSSLILRIQNRIIERPKRKREWTARRGRRCAAARLNARAAAAAARAHFLRRAICRLAFRIRCGCRPAARAARR